VLSPGWAGIAWAGIILVLACVAALVVATVAGA